MVLKAVLEGFGIGFCQENEVSDYLQTGELIQCLSEWTSPFSGYHHYYPSRFNDNRLAFNNSAFAMIRAALHRGI